MKKTSHNRIIPVIASIAVQLCLGVAYIWSVFQTGIATSIFGGDNAAAGLTFSFLLATLTIGSVLGGKLAVRFGTQKIIILGGIILSVGFFLASFVTSAAPRLLWLTYGFMGGVGMGFTYSTTIAVAQKWFPEKRGMVTGLIVAALGFGGVVFTPIVTKLIATFGGQGVGEFKTFRVLSLIFLVVCSVCGIFVKNPPADFAPANVAVKNAAKAPVVHEYSPMEVLRKPQFYIVMFTFMFACMGGLMMIGFAKPIAIAKGLAETATVGVLAITLCNSLGRLFWGFVSDKIGRKYTIITLLTGSAIMSLLVNSAKGNLIFVLIGMIGFFYGGFLSVFPSLTADLFGPKNMATNYGMILLGFGIGAVAASYIAGHYKNLAATNIDLMFPAFVIAAGCAVLGIILMLFLKQPPKKKRNTLSANRSPAV